VLLHISTCQLAFTSYLSALGSPHSTVSSSSSFQIFNTHMILYYYFTISVRFLKRVLKKLIGHCYHCRLINYSFCCTICSKNVPLSVVQASVSGHRRPHLRRFTQSSSPTTVLLEQECVEIIRTTNHSKHVSR